MKNVLKSSLSFFLAITIIFSSAYVGLNEVDFGELFAVKAKAYSALTFELNEDGTTYKVVACNNKTSGGIIIPKTHNDKPVTSIGDYAFRYCSYISSVTIPDSITSIGSSAFDNCYSLESVYITDIAAWCNIDFGNSYASPLCCADTLYINGKLATDVIIPSGVTKIPDYGFACKSLTSIKIPDSVTSIGAYAFRGCTSLTSITIPDGVTVIPDYTFYNCTSLKSIKIPANVISIGSVAFADCTSLTSITIPNSVTSIGSSAFADCTSLTSITIPNSVTSIGGRAFYNTDYYNNGSNWKNDVLYIGSHFIKAKDTLSGEYIIRNGTKTIAGSAFCDCTSLTSIIIPEGVTSIGGGAFDGCDSLTSITIPDSVTSIGGRAFSFCDSLASVTIGNGVTSIDYAAFESCKKLVSVTIGEGVTSIGDSAFRGCTSLTSITIPDSVTSIGDYAFYNCTSLEKVYWNAKNVSDFSMSSEIFYNAGTSGVGIEFVFGDSVEKIPAYLCCYFGSVSYAPKVISITLGDNVTSIGDYAFRGCTSLTSITIPDSVTSIGSFAFSGCSSVKSITIPESVTSIGNSAFSSWYNLESVYITDIAAWCSIDFGDSYANPLCYADTLYINGKLATDVIIPSGVTKIPDYGFSCQSLTSITIPDGVTSIGGCAFSDCTSLTSITIPDSVISIGNDAFIGCTSLTSITIPDSVTSIGDYAFYNCTSLEKVYWNAKNVSDFSEESEMFYKAGTSGSGIEFVFGDTVEKIPAYLCYVSYSSKRPKVISVTFGDNVTSIGDYVFYNCENLTSVTIGNSVTSIGDYVFYNCENLTSVTIGNSVTSIGYYAFTADMDIFFSGTSDKWTSICKSSMSSDVRVHYNTLSNHSVETVLKEPSCTEVGIKVVSCDCGYSRNVAIPLSDHKYGEWEILLKQTCTEEGSKTSTCAECGSTETVAIPADGHTYSTEWTIDSEATCKRSGSKSRHCLTCDRKTDVTTIPATGVHTPGEWYIEYNATCTREGSKYRCCTDCGETLERVTILKSEHTPSDWKIDKKATASAAGSKHKECTECGEVLETATIKQLKCSKPSLKKIENTKDGVKITWGKISGADKYDVYRKTGSSGKYSKIATVKGNSKVTYTDKSAKSGKKYYYNVKAVNEAGSSSASKAKSILYLADTTLSTPKSTKNGITLKWKKVTGAEGYQVWRKTGSGSYKKIATVKGNSKVTYTDKKAQKGKTYTYKIRAYKDKTTSAYSNTKKIKDKY